MSFLGYEKFTMKTTLYIDGYNLYYGALRGSPYKWLDIVKLFTKLTKERSPEADIVAVKLFTAPVRIRFANHGEASQKSQRDYHKALEKLYSEFSIILGYFNPTEGWYPRYQTPVDRDDTVRAWDLKNSDWVRSYINEQELKDCQLPEKIPTKKKPLFKPQYW